MDVNCKKKGDDIELNMMCCFCRAAWASLWAQADSTAKEQHIGKSQRQAELWTNSKNVHQLSSRVAQDR